MECTQLVPLSDDWEGAPIDHAYTSHYGDAHYKEGDHPTSTQPRRREDPLHPGACSRVGLTSVNSATLHHVGAAGWSGRGKVLIPNPEYKGKCHTESTSSNLTPRVQ
jgi:hypothetical protein